MAEHPQGHAIDFERVPRFGCQIQGERLRTDISVIASRGNYSKDLWNACSDVLNVRPPHAELFRDCFPFRLLIAPASRRGLGTLQRKADLDLSRQACYPESHVRRLDLAAPAH